MKIYHYTSLDALLNILTNDKIVFRATRYDAMNDPLDYIFARDILIPKLRKSLEKFNISEDDKEYIEQSPYIVSFSEKEDDFNMWRMYKSEVSLEFEYEDIQNCISNNMRIGKCEYVNENNIDYYFLNAFNKIEFSNKILCDAQDVIVLLKREEFQPEKEIRLYNCSHNLFKAQYIGNNDCEFNECETSDLNVKARVRDNDLVLYQEFILPKKALTGITIFYHDVEHFSSLKEHIKIILNERDYSNKVIDNIKQTKTTKFKHL